MTDPADGFRPDKPWLVTRRAILFGLALVPFNVYWVIYAEYRLYNVLTLNPLFVTPIFYLFVLVLVNAALARIAPKYRFDPAEMVLVYTMLVMSCTIATHDYIINAVTTISWAHWLARLQPDFDRNVTPLLPRWLTVSDAYALKGFFQGSASMYEHRVLMAWAKPLAFWSGFIMVCGWVMLCLTVIFRRAWMEDVKLSFPIVRLPFSLIDPDENRATLRNPLLWVGFGIAAGIGLWNGLHNWFPSLPMIQVRAIPIRFTQPPWSAMGWSHVTFYPFAIGLCYLVPLDISFSCWFFHLFIKAQSVIGCQLGYGSVPDFPYAHEQGIGAWFAFAIALLYASRNHLRRVWRAAAPRRKVSGFRGSRNTGEDTALGGMREVVPLSASQIPKHGDVFDAREPLSYRAAVWGLAVGVGLLLVFWRAAGMGIVWAVLTLFTYLLVSISITRVRAESGGQHAV